MGSSPAITTPDQADNLAKLVLSGIELLGEAALFRFTRAEQLDHGQNLQPPVVPGRPSTWFARPP